MKEELWLIWKEPHSRRRYKVGILTKQNKTYQFVYVNPELEDAQSVGFKYFPGFEQLNKVYENDSLFINIATRLPNINRPDYLEILNCYNLNKNADDFTILKATRGRNITDNYEFVPAFDDSKLEFEVAGTTYSVDIEKCKNNLKVNDRLYLEPEPENSKDNSAIKVMYKLDGKTYHLGYVPRYYNKDLLLKLNQGKQYSAMIESLNLDSQISDEKITAYVKLIINN